MESKKEIIKSLIKLVLPSVLINSILPLVLYHFFMIYFSSLNSLIIAITAPIFYNIYEVLKEKKVDAFGILMLASFAMGIGCVFLGGSEKFLLLKESFVTYILGFTFLITLLLKKPLVYYFILKFESDKETFNKYNYLNKNIPNLNLFSYVDTIENVVKNGEIIPAKVVYVRNSLSYDAMTAHTAVVFTRYMILSLESRESNDNRSLGELFLYFSDEMSDIT